MSRPDAAILQHLLAAGARHFLETGSFHGGGISTALNCGFDRVTSIECVREFYDECCQKFATPLAEGRLNLLLGDSAVVVGDVCKSVEEPILFWLKTHFQNTENEFSAQNCPLNAEIAAIVARGNQRDVILIDDLRLLQNSKAWRGHDVVLDDAMGRLQRAFPDHVAFRMDGYIPRDIFALMPIDIAQSFFMCFPNGRAAGQIDIVPETSNKFPLIIVGGGNNDRIGNYLPLYGRLLQFAASLGRPLSFPFAERRIAQIFDFLGDPPDLSSGEDATYKRLVRSAEESAEKTYAPDQYPAGVAHVRDFFALGLRVIFFRGSVDWLAFANSNGFNWDGALVMKDPYPFTFIPMNAKQSIASLKSRMQVKPELISKAQAARRLTAGKKFDLCLHIRQGDFKQFAGGSYWFDLNLVSAIIRKIQSGFKSQRRSLSITLLSDGDIPEEFYKDHGVSMYRGSMADDFVRLAIADLVLSNNSSFSRIAAEVGGALLGSAGKYFALGVAENAPEAMDRVLADIFQKMKAGKGQDSQV